MDKMDGYKVEYDKYFSGYVFFCFFSGLIDCENTDIPEGINNSEYIDNI